MDMKYIVTLGYSHFAFDNATEAMLFAETAKKHYSKFKHYDDRELEVKIDILDAKEEEEEED